MSEHGSKTYRPGDPERSQQAAESPSAQLSAGDVVFLLLDTVPRLDWRRFSAPYAQETRGAPPYDPAMRTCLLRYASCVGVFSSRTIALACERQVACIAMVGEERPDFRPLSAFRKDHLAPCRELVVHVLRLAKDAGLVKRGTVSTDGTTIQGKASRHKARSSGSMQKEVERLRAESEALVTQAVDQDEAAAAVLGSRRGDELPAERERRAKRLGAIEAAMQRWEAQAKADADAERQRRADADTARARTGPKRRGRAPQPVEDTPPDKAQMRFTDAELPIMPTNKKGWDSCGNAPVSTDGAYQIL